MYLVRIAGEGELVVGQTRPGEFATVAPSAVITMPCAVLTRTAAMLWLNVAQTKRTIRARIPRGGRRSRHRLQTRRGVVRASEGDAAEDAHAVFVAAPDGAGRSVRPTPPARAVRAG